MSAGLFVDVSGTKAYSRFWEGRQIWQQILDNGRQKSPVMVSARGTHPKLLDPQDGCLKNLPEHEATPSSTVWE